MTFLITAEMLFTKKDTERTLMTFLMLITAEMLFTCSRKRAASFGLLSPSWASSFNSSTPRCVQPGPRARLAREGRARR